METEEPWYEMPLEDEDMTFEDDANYCDWVDQQIDTLKEEL